MSTLMDLVDQLGDAVGEKPAPRLKYVDGYVRRFDHHTLRQVRADLEKWASEGDSYAAEALQILRDES